MRRVQTLAASVERERSAAPAQRVRPPVPRILESSAAPAQRVRPPVPPAVGETGLSPVAATPIPMELIKCIHEERLLEQTINNFILKFDKEMFENAKIYDTSCS